MKHTYVLPAVQLWASLVVSLTCTVVTYMSFYLSVDRSEMFRGEEKQTTP